MELLQLKYFCDAAETQNYSKTAKKFYVPTSNISQSVKRLERELGVELFEHRANRIVLADSGKRFYEKVKTAIVSLEEAKSEALGDSDEMCGEIKLLIFCNRRLVTEAIESFKKQNPRVTFVLRHELEADIDYDLLISDTCPPDCAERYPLVEDEILLAVSKSNPISNIENLSLKDLKDERFISMPRGRSLYSITNSICSDAGFTPNISIQTDDPFYVRKYVEMGLGIAFFPSCSWEGLFSDAVAIRKIGNYTRSTYVCLPSTRKVKREVSEFLKHLSALTRSNLK